MWTRALLKENAKAALRKSYWRIFLICLVAGLLTGSTVTSSGWTVRKSVEDFSQQSTTVGFFFSILACLAGLSGLLWSIFAASPLRVGRCRVMMENRVGDVPFDSLFSVFRTHYGNIVYGMFLTNLYIFLYSLLLVIPGIIKSYEYYMVPWLLAENPEMEPARARELSRLMTDGEKLNIFVMELSFFGWRILCMMTGGIGTLFLDPYYFASFAELYAAMRAKAFALGYSDASELGDFVRY